VTAGFQCHVEIRALAVLLRSQQCISLGMKSAILLVISFTDDMSVLYDNTPHHGIGRNPSLSQPGKRKRPAHILFPVCHENLLSSTFRQKENSLQMCRECYDST
jgi:hypothetical protein